MEKAKINLFNNFGIISVIMPYFGKTHKCFLLLSSLCCASRRKLNEYYEEFRKIMIRYSLEFDIQDDDMEKILLPNDLFRFNIYVYQKESIQVLIKLVENILEGNGWYFCNHFMHKQLCFKKIYSVFDVIELLYPYADVMCSIESIKYYDYSKSEPQFEETTLINQIVLFEYNSNYK